MLGARKSSSLALAEENEMSKKYKFRPVDHTARRPIFGETWEWGEEMIAAITNTKKKMGVDASTSAVLIKEIKRKEGLDE